MNNLPKVVAQQRRGRASNPRLLDRKSDALPLSHRATLKAGAKHCETGTGSHLTGLLTTGAWGISISQFSVTDVSSRVEKLTPAKFMRADLTPVSHIFLPVITSPGKTLPLKIHCCYFWCDTDVRYFFSLVKLD